MALRVHTRGAMSNLAIQRRRTRSTTKTNASKETDPKASPDTKPDAKKTEPDAITRKPKPDQVRTSREATRNDVRTWQVRKGIDEKLDAKSEKEGFVRDDDGTRVFKGTSKNERYEVTQNEEGALRVKNLDSKKEYWLTSKEAKESVRISTGDGDDRVKIDSSVRADVDVEGGDGNDTIDATNTNGWNRLSGGGGDDRIVGGNNSILEGGDGDNDELVNTSRTYRPPDGIRFHPPGSEEERTQEVEDQQRETVNRSLTSGQFVPFTTSEGQTVDVKVDKTAEGYRYQLDGRTVKVSFDDSFPEADQPDHLAKLIDYHAQTTPYARDVFDEVRFRKKEDPKSNTAAYYSADSRSLTFLTAQNLTEDTFNHEVGHGVAYKASFGDSSVPPGWDDAVSADGNEISGYGTKSFLDRSIIRFEEVERIGEERTGLRADDFAESYAAYAEAKESGPEALAQFESRYPNRARFLKPLFEETSPLRDSPMPVSEDAPIYG